MDSIEIVLAMILAVVASGYLVRVLPFSLPLPLVQILLGAVIAAGSRHGVAMDPEIFFLLFLPPLLFLDGWRIPKDGLFRDKAAILQLALGLVVFTVVGAGFLIHALIPAMPMAVAFALAAIVSPTDPLAVSSITARTPIPRRLMHILEGEALLNDASGLVCFQFAVVAALTGSFSPISASLTFLWVTLAGVLIGIGITVIATFTQRWLSQQFGEESGSPILISLLIPFGAYLLAEWLRASGILAAVAAGITMSYVELSGRALATTRVQRAAVWDTVHFAMNGVVFVLLGEQLPNILRGAIASVDESGHLNPCWLVAYAVTISLGLAVLRFIWVWVSLHLTLFRARPRGEHVAQPQWRLVLAMSLAGVRGAITLAGVMTLPLLLPGGERFPARDLAVFLAAAVILLSLVTASLGLPRILEGLALPAMPGDQLDEDRARIDAARAAIDAIERVRHDRLSETVDPEIFTHAAARVLELYRHRLGGAMPASSEAGQLRKAERAEQALRLAGLQAERDHIYTLARQSKISDETARKIVREIDLVESRYR